MNTCILDGNQIGDKDMLHDILADSLKLPEWYGRNLDALYDCLVDLQEETEIRVFGGAAMQERLGKYAAALLRVLGDAAEENRRIHLVREEMP